MNVVVITGNLVAKPEKHVTQSGISQAVMNVAVQRDFKNAQTGEREADFIRVIAWRQTADFLAQYAEKGDRVTIRGALTVRTYEKDGQKRYVTEVNADRAELNKRNQGNAAAQGAEQTDDSDEEMPF